MLRDEIAIRFPLRMTQECFQEFAPTCVHPTSASLNEARIDMLHLNGFPVQLTVNSSSAWCF